MTTQTPGHPEKHGLSTGTENDGKKRENGQEQRGREDGAPSRSLARA